MVDSSTSIGEKRFHHILKFLKEQIMELNIEGRSLNVDEQTRVAFASFSDAVVNHFHLKTYSRKWDIINAVTGKYTGDGLGRLTYTKWSHLFGL